MAAAALVGRVGGLAATLGAGVAISLAASAPASAEPTDSHSSRVQNNVSGSRSDSGGAAARRADAEPAGNRSVRPARRGASEVRSARAGRDVLTAPSAKEDLPAAAAPVSRGGTTKPGGVPAAASVAGSSVSGPSMPAATVPATPVTATSTPVTNPLAALLGCDPRGRRITIFKGTHFALPNSFGYFTKQVSGTGTFTPDTVYDLKDEDQYDWNKFTGIAFTPLEPDRNSVMVGWRYNLSSQEFEIAPFYNVDKKRILPDEQTEVISVPVGETFDYSVDYTGVRVSYGGKTVYKPYPQGLKPNVWTASRVSGWFGGNEAAPRTISYYLKFAR